MNETSQNPDQRNISRRILVIEDNLDSAETLQTFLHIYGHEVSVAHSAAAGLKNAQEIVPDVIICDIGLSGELDGLDVAKEVRKLDALSSVYLIALSGYGQPEDKEKSKSAGFDLHLVKPADFDALLRLLENFDR